MNNTAAKPNTREKFLQVPHALRGIRVTANDRSRKLNRSELKALSAVYSFTFAKNGGSAFTYSEFATRYHASAGTVGRAIRAAVEAKLIRRKDNPHEYELTDEVKQRIEASAKKEGGVPPFLKIEDWIYHAKFGGRFLRQSEIDVLFYLISFKPGDEYFPRTDRYICRKLKYSPTTVSAAINSLDEIGLIQIVGRKARNGHERTTYTVNDNLLRNKRNAILRPRSKGKSADVKAADAKSEREAYYARNRARAERRAEFMQKEARADERYAKADAEVRRLEPKYAKATVYNLAERFELGKRLRAAQMICAERLTALGISADDLEPRWTCTKCEDTGFDIKTKCSCDCYPPGGQRP